MLTIRFQLITSPILQGVRYIYIHNLIVHTISTLFMKLQLHNVASQER